MSKEDESPKAYEHPHLVGRNFLQRVETIRIRIEADLYDAKRLTEKWASLVKAMDGQHEVLESTRGDRGVLVKHLTHALNRIESMETTLSDYVRNTRDEWEKEFPWCGECKGRYHKSHPHFRDK